MKPKLEHLPLDSDESFVVRDFDYSFYPTPWHFHPEYELVLVTESTGKRIIGDDISSFEAGDLALIGPNVPHLYKNDDIYYESSSTLRAKSVVVHFLESSFGQGFLTLPESSLIKNILQQSHFGLAVLGEAKQKVIPLLIQLSQQKGMERWLTLVEILNIISHSAENKILSKNGVKAFNNQENERLSSIFNYVDANYHKDIKLKDIADLVNMAENSLSRFFSQQTRKSFSDFLIEFRLNKASKLLVEKETSIINVCFECGFRNISNFNKQFKRIYGFSPLKYRKQFSEL
ncbi:MAG: AraC family transcriptional regulator [Pedobacter sp.]|nr:AraC family transcriptional regulator [Pedobacter sp.]